MRKKIKIYFLLSLMSSYTFSFSGMPLKMNNGETISKSSEFKFHYKNLNALGAIICSLEAPKKPVENNNTVRLSKIDSDIDSMTNSHNSDFSDGSTIELSGICNSEININTKEILSFGQGLSLEFNTKLLNIVRGKLGLKEIIISFHKMTPTSIMISDPMSKSRKSFNLSETTWSKTNSIVNFNKKDLISIKFNGRTLAMENSSRIKLNRTNFYNIWNYSSFGCESFQNHLTQDKCQQLTELL